MSEKQVKTKRFRRRGATLIFVACLMMGAVTMVAVVIDIGYLALTVTQLHAAADSAALAGGMDLIKGLGFDQSLTPGDTMALARQSAVTFAANNRAGDQSSVYADGDRDVRFGNAIYDTASGTWTQSWGTEPYNMIEVQLLRDQSDSTSGDGPLPLFFSGLVGVSADFKVIAAAALLPSYTFHVPPGSPLTAPIMPFSMDLATWDQLINGTTLQDIYNYDHNSNTVSDGPDGVGEVNLYPTETGDSANRGTVNLGAPDNSADDLARQILSGLNDSDFSYFSDGSITASPEEPLTVTGDPGLTAGMKAALESIIGQPRAIAVYDTVTDGTGTNKIYTIIKFVGVRIVHVELTGNDKAVYVQPATVVDGTLVPKLDEPISPDSLFSPIILIQ